MPYYKVSSGGDYWRTIWAPTKGKAKYQNYFDMKEWGIPYTDIRCRLDKDHEPDFTHMNSYYGLTFLRKGLLCECDGVKGKVEGADGPYLLINGEKPGRYHPIWKMSYFTEDGTLIWRDRNEQGN